MARYEAKLDIAKEFEKSFSLPLFTGDSASSIGLEFYQNGVPYDMSGAMLYARRGDGVVLASSGVAEGNRAELTLHNQMYVCPGELQVQISVVDVYGNFLTNGVLYFTVREGFSEQAQGEGGEDYCDLTSLIRQVGEGLGSIQRAEKAANAVEFLLEMIPDLENRVIRFISEQETNEFTKGFAIVSTIETVDSEGGPIATEYQYPLMAECEDLFGTLTITQTRFFKGKWEQRRVGEPWKKIVSDSYTKEEIDSKLSSVYRYKGTVKNTSDLPTSNLSVGDVWNVETAGAIGDVLKLIPLTSVGFDSADAWNGYYDAALYPVLLSEEEGNQIDLYDENYNKVGSNVYANYTASAQCLFILPFNIQPGYENAKYFQLSSGSAYGETIVLGSLVEAGDNVAWNGTEWDVLSGTIDLSGYATKEDVNTTLSSIYKYKGTVENYTDLPSNANNGDVYNIEKGYHVSKDMKPITIVDSWSDEVYSYAIITPYTNLPPFYFSGSGLTPIANVYDKNLNKITEIGFYDMDKIKGNNDVVLEVGKKYYLEYFGVEQIDLDYETDIITVKFDINEGENVAWTGTEWDRLAGTADMSCYVTKEELGSIEAALSRIESLQNAYINGSEV